MEKKFFVSGMHCTSCELLIEEKIKDEKIGKAKADASKGELVINSNGELSVEKLNKIFKDEGYYFSEKPIPYKRSRKQIIKGASIAIIIAGAFYLLNRAGFGGIANVTSNSSFISFIILGLLAGFSSCAALVGGLVLALSENWMEKKEDTSFSGRARPHIAFNAGRLTSYAFFGSLLGLAGEKLSLSPVFGGVLVVLASVIMVVMGLKMLGVRIPSVFPGKRFSHSILNKAEKAKRHAPFVSGFLTFFLPCGFTISAQSAALASGSLWTGGVMMFAFALGTVPSLFAIGISGSSMASDKKRGAVFSAAAGFLLLLFAVFNVNNQLNIMGFPSLNDIGGKTEQAKEVALKPAAIQVIRMDAYSYAYKPNRFTVKAGIPVRWEITDKGTSGCTNAIIARGLIKGSISLSRGKTSVVEFTPTKKGIYKFSCWMGMIQGKIEVIK